MLGWTQLVPCVPHYSIIQCKETQYKTSNKNNFNTRHRTSPLDPLDLGQSVWITGRRDSGVVIKPAETPKSYLVSTPTGCIRRNRQHLTTIPESHSDPDITVQTPEENNIIQPLPTDNQTTRSGRLSFPPNHLISDPVWNT